MVERLLHPLASHQLNLTSVVTIFPRVTLLFLFPSCTYKIQKYGGRRADGLVREWWSGYCFAVNRSLWSVSGC